EHRVDLPGAEAFQQPRHDRIAKVEQQPEPVVFHQKAAARLARFRPRAAATEHRQPHLKDSTGRARPAWAEDRPSPQPDERQRKGWPTRYSRPSEWCLSSERRGGK